jgi:hypothetical protein
MLGIDRGQLKFRPGQLEIPRDRRTVAIQVEDDLYGERSTGEEAVAAGAEGIGGGCGSKVRHGLDNGAEIPARSKTAERDATKAYVENAAGSVCGYVGRDSAVADGRTGFANLKRCLNICKERIPVGSRTGRCGLCGAGSSTGQQLSLQNIRIAL